jgi:hypothetical protein
MEQWPQLQPLVEWIVSNGAWVLLAALALRFWAWITDKRFGWRKELAFWVFVPPVLFFAFSRAGLLNRPRLSVNIDRLHITAKPLAQAFAAPSPNLNKDELGLIIVASVRNAGAQSMADCCTFSITIPGSGTVFADPIQFPQTFNVTDQTGAIVDTYSGTDALYEKLGGHPIATGEMIRGVLLFGIAGMSYTTLSNPGTEYNLNLTDVTGTIVSGKLAWPIKPIGPSSGYLAGLAGGACPVQSPGAIPSAAVVLQSPNGNQL